MANKIVVQGDGFGFVFDKTKGDFDSYRSAAHCRRLFHSRASHHALRFRRSQRPQFTTVCSFSRSQHPQFERIEIKRKPAGLRLIVHDHYQNFRGSTSWLIDNNGRGMVSCDYKYSGPTMDTREAGIRLLMKSACNEVKWRRWSEWGVFPKESISRTEGSAKAHRDPKLGSAGWNQQPAWPWSLDETELGTADFRSVKLNIYEAGLRSPNGSGLVLHANADAHFRAALTPSGVEGFLLSRCSLGQVPLTANDHLKGEFVVQLLPRR